MPKPFVKNDSRINRKGRPRGSRDKYTAEKLAQAIETVENRKNTKKFLVHLVEQAYKDNTLAAVLLRKLIPDIKTLDTDGGEDWLDEELEILPDNGQKNRMKEFLKN